MSAVRSRALLAAALVLAGGPVALASDHLDAPALVADPAADLGDLYAWLSDDGRRLHLVLTVVGGRFSDQIDYVVHVDHGADALRTTASARVACRFTVAGQVRCRSGAVDVAGDADREQGLSDADRRLRVFAGLRDDPFANNVVGARQAYAVAAEALAAGASRDAAGCPRFDEATATRLAATWHRTDGGPARDFLAGWNTAALVLDVDAGWIAGDSPLLAVWAGSYARSPGDDAGPSARGRRFDRIGRPLAANALLGPLDPAAQREARKEAYNAADRAQWAQFVPDIARTLALYDGFDGRCGNQWMAGQADDAARYRVLAERLADDRLWIDRGARRCARFLAVEQGLGGPGGDCGGRRPDLDAADVFRSLLVTGRESGIDDGVDMRGQVRSTTRFPFLAPPSGAGSRR